MAKTLLNGVNEVLKRVSIIQGDSGLLTSLTDGARQTYIDIAIQTWNEAIDDLYETSDMPKPNELAENTITLATGDRDYALQTDLNQLRFPLIDQTNGQYIHEYPGGYTAIMRDQAIPGNFTGLSLRAAIRETDGQLYLDREPTATENGLVYKYWYDKDLELTAAGDTMPFKDVVFRAMVPVVSELWKRDQKNSFDGQLYSHNLGRAARYLTQKQQDTSWLPKRVCIDTTDPFNV